MENKKIIIAIDGYSSSGKSTVAKQIAHKLGYKYIDSGAMYRAITLFSLREKIIVSGKEEVNEEKLRKALDQIHINFKYNKDLGRQETFLNNENVEDEIRKMEVSNSVSHVSKVKFVREEMVKLQQEFGKEKGIVMDGRDIGTVVFPNAEVKIFMTAGAEARAQRRYKELLEKGEKVNLQEIIENVKQRDHIDETREESPLRQAEDAVVVDNSNLSPDQQLTKILEIINKSLVG